MDSDSAVSLPTGTLTFLMTDIEGSTRMWNAQPREAKTAIERHDQMVMEHVARSQGHIVESGREGDSILAVFKHASHALNCALEAQRSFQREQWPPGVEMRVRIAVHSGEAELKAGHYVGAPLYRCARLLETGHGGQILVSGATEELAADSLGEGVSLLDLGTHRLRDFSRPVRIHQLVHADLDSEFPPLRSPAAQQVHLPQQLTSFVGRQADVEQVRELLAKTRLVTLTGPGGIGKSRLAAELVATTAEGWTDGVWWVDLASIDDPRLVAGTVMGALGIRAAGSSIEAITAWLAVKHALVVVDGCEHVVSACADLCRNTLERCPEVTILATSREALGVAGESRWPLAPMVEADALSLFERRGQLVLPGFRITDANRSDVLQVCRRLDYLPLAMELAASRLGMLSVAELSRHLLAGFDVLPERRSSASRHQTVTATIDWSYKLLTPSEASLFRRLSVFRGGFTIVSATKVCGDPAVPDVLEALSGLVDKSMVVVERLAENETRYRLLELQAAYAEDKLGAADEWIHKRHYDFFLEAMRARSAMLVPGVTTGSNDPQETWKRREWGNLWAALSWAKGHEANMGIELATEVAYMLSGDLTRGSTWLADLLDHSPAQGPIRMLALRAAASTAFRQGKTSERLRLNSELLQMARVMEDVDQMVLALNGIGGAQMDTGRLQEAKATFISALRLVEGSPNARLRGLIENDIGCVALVQGRYEHAREVLAACVARLRANETTRPQELAATVESLANAELGCGEVQRADELWREALVLSRDVQDDWNSIGNLGGLARSASARGDHVRALRLAAAHESLSTEFSSRDQPWWAEQIGLSAERSREQLGPERSRIAWHEGESMSLDSAVAYALSDVWAAPALN